MTDQRAKLEAVAREWLLNNEIAHWGGRTSALADLLAAQRVAVLEEAAAAIVQAHRMGDSDRWLDLAEHFRQQAKEQRP